MEYLTIIALSPEIVGPAVDSYNDSNIIKRWRRIREFICDSIMITMLSHAFVCQQPGQLFPAVIHNHQSYGVFVELPGGLRGLVPKKVY